MTRVNEGGIVALLMIVYPSATILMYISLNGDTWVNYNGGHSGLWNDCNTTHSDDNSTTSREEDGSEQDECNYIYIDEAPGFLHVTRAIFIIGYIVWCVGLVQRYLTWQYRGTGVDKQIILAAVLSSILVSSAGIVYQSKFYPQEYEDNTEKYADPDLAQHYVLAYVGSGLAAFLGILTIRHHNMFNEDGSSINFTNHCPLLGRFCGKRVAEPQTSRQLSRSDYREENRRHRRRSAISDPSGSILDISVISTSNTQDSPRQSSRTYDRHSISNIQSLGFFGAVFSARLGTCDGHGGRRRDIESGTDSVDVVSIVSFSGTSEGSSESTRRDGIRNSHVSPINLMTMPPAYDDVLRDGASPEANLSPPPTYDEATANCELVLSTPPRYQESAT